MGELRPIPMPRLEHDLDRADPLTSNLREVRPHPDPFAPKRGKPCVYCGGARPSCCAASRLAASWDGAA